MKRISLISLLILICSLPGYSQFWIEFGWNDRHCRQCENMARTLHMTQRQAKDYHKVVHKYGQKIEKEARRDYKHWDKAAKKIYNLRMDRDNKLQRILSPGQFYDYVRITRDRPQAIHDYRGWYENPRYAGYRHSPEWRRYEDRYWSHHWNVRPTPPPRKERYSVTPNSPNKNTPPRNSGNNKNKQKDKQKDKDRYERDSRGRR